MRARSSISQGTIRTTNTATGRILMSMLPFDDRDGFIWYDGRLVAWRDAKLHVLSHGLHYASCVFEGERVYNGTVFRLEDHNERLLNSARILGFDVPVGMDDLAKATQE